MIDLKIKRKTNVSTKEYHLHLICKVLLSKKIHDAGRDARVEFEVFDPITNTKRFVDVLDITRSVMYEIERKPTAEYKKKFLEFSKNIGAVGVIIDLTHLNKTIKGLEPSLNELERIMKYYGD